MIRAQRWLVLALLLIVCQWMFGLADIVRSWAGLGGQAPQQVLQTQLSRFDTTTTWTKRIVAVGGESSIEVCAALPADLVTCILFRLA